MKKVTKVLSLMLVLMMIVSSFAACGKDEDKASSDGKVLNIYCWNDEFKRRMQDHYPGYEKTDDGNGKIGDVVVKWHETASADGAYQNALDAALDAQSGAKADDKVDLFLVEADYALKYVDDPASMNVKDLGVTDADLANQYKYTKDIVTDSKGNLKGVSWQGCPGLLVYRRDIAKEVLGSDDPAEVQKAVADWATFEKTAETMKGAGYFMVSGYDDTYRVFSNNVTSSWVVDGKLNIDDQLMAWVEQTKKFTDAGYNNKTSLWNDAWNTGFYPESKVFCYFGPAWFIDFSMKADDAKSIAANGGWAATEGPQGFFWGGTWMCAATGTDNADLVKDIMLKMTCTESVMKGIVTKDNDFVNNKPAMEAMAKDTSYQNKVLGGQNPLGMFCASAGNIDLKYLTGYDQICNEQFQAAMKDYFDGNATLDEALATFKAKVVEKYPAIKVD